MHRPTGPRKNSLPRFRTYSDSNARRLGPSCMNPIVKASRRRCSQTRGNRGEYGDPPLRYCRIGRVRVRYETRHVTGRSGGGDTLSGVDGAKRGSRGRRSVGLASLLVGSRSLLATVFRVAAQIEGVRLEGEKLTGLNGIRGRSVSGPV